MPVISVRIPQIGEGLQEARLVAVLKQPGDYVKRDEPIYQMETDKAVMDVESPYEGTLVEWLGQPDEILAIGAEVARMEVAGAVEEAPPHGHAPAPVEAAAASARGAAIPPRTRAYAKEKGVSDDQLASIPSASGKLMPADIDAFLSGPGPVAPVSTDRYDEQPVAQKQRLLASRLVRGAQLVVPGTMTLVANWEAIEHARARYKSGGGDFQPSSFTMFAYAVALALKDYPAFRSTLIGEDRLRTYRHVSLGIAVSLPGDELVLAVVEDADTLTWREFAQRTRERIDLARTGKDQANEAMTISLTNMQSFGLRDAVPVVVPPAVATLFLGETYQDLDPATETPKLRRVVNLALTFDHRILNGVGAAEFMKAVRQNVETIGSLID
ncbi:2-oxo acid dehydrogenase subunit E2 [Fimbriimonas ginsengisoli]|uniref:Dihydrolipoamide acetyltransferase component of pyruvate dehydrogenase complex n=1 Tax=Fimbriimonas ginsengisoli Gsoil 348 TaxID=661478 RepID=A0A068NX64_FIMGI|nr:2-oxo acid dehydrogenase subunit E2 [Fimbriimonas ginsengisoli]AIE86214.1 branched-chain alpha-keto acid dehydrogenase subunit E2 [Fimbriimonas ginsengisoli Gsoil 348]